MRSPLRVEVFNGFIIEAENIINTGDITEEDKNFVEKINGVFGKKTDAPASGGAYVGSVFNGDVMRFHIYVEEDCYANLILWASSCNMLVDGGSWDPVVMGDMQFNRLFDIKYGSAAEAESGSLKPIEVDDDVILPGGETDNPAGDRALWANWKDVDFGTIPLTKGDNIVEMTVISDYVNVREPCACNIDRLEIEYTENYTPPATVESLTITKAPAKTEYKVGESFDPTGMEIQAAMSDGTTETADLAKCTFTPSGALTTDVTKVTVNYKGATVEQEITVTAAESIVIEGENLIADPTADDKFYVEAVRNGYQGSIAAGDTEAPEAPTSGGKYLKGLFGSSDGTSGAVARFHIFAEEDCRATIKIWVSSCNVVTQGTDGSSPWRPSEMGDVQFNQIFAVKFGTADSLAPVTIGDDVIVEGGKTEDGTVSMALWENWREITLGTFDLKAGDNIIELENINSTLTNLAGEIYGMNIDRMVIDFE